MNEPIAAAPKVRFMSNLPFSEPVQLRNSGPRGWAIRNPVYAPDCLRAGLLRFLPFPFACRISVMRRLPAELAVFQLCREDVIPIGRVKVDFKDVVPEGRGRDIHSSVGRRNRAADLLSILLELERKGRFTLLS